MCSTISMTTGRPLANIRTSQSYEVELDIHSCKINVLGKPEEKPQGEWSSLVSPKQSVDHYA